MAIQVENFDQVRLKLASPENILKWSYGEVLKPETINYRTQKPEKDGLFCERIFGPTKDWECYCGKYKRIRYKGVVCDKCGVEVTRSIVRRERMGHIKLAVPVSHIWFLRGVPSKIGLILDLSVQQLEKVIYFASYIVTKVDEQARALALEQIDQELKRKKQEIEQEYGEKQSSLKGEWDREKIKIINPQKLKAMEEDFLEALKRVQKEKKEELDKLFTAYETAQRELKGLQRLQVISEIEYRNLSRKYGHVFKAGIGAEAVREIAEEINMHKLAKSLEKELMQAGAAKKRKIIRRLGLIRSMIQAHIRPEWMFLTVLPVLPPDLRPMVQLDGGRFAASDLNDLYRRVINRNNRLKRLLELGAPEVICRNEKRMLQEAVDALLDNSARHTQTVTASTGQKRQLKSLADMLKGKQGRFRQNLLGKRVDYSGRSVIVIGPELKLFQCGLPKKMALELFRPFVINILIKKELAHNIRSANKLIDAEIPEVWDALDEVTKGHHVLLNRAPTLHRLGIQAFQPVLIEGKAIQIHPMVCTAFNADFDGDQMAAHVPLSTPAREEARDVMLSTNNLLKPATGEPITTPSQDVVLGCYYLTRIKPNAKGGGKVFASFEEALLAYEQGIIAVNASIKVAINGAITETSVGRILFNEVLPEGFSFVNEPLDKKSLRIILAQVLEQFGQKETSKAIDRLKDLGFQFATRSGISWGMDDLQVPKEKKIILEEAERAVEKITGQYEAGLLTDEERYHKVVQIWAEVKDKVSDLLEKEINKESSVFSLVNSGARGSWGQVTQMAGMKGLVTNPAGRIIELPVKASFKEGFNVLEYFISSHGTRKGMADTALRTATAGYLTRRLVDVAQDVVIREEDCKDKEGVWITKEDCEEAEMDLPSVILGRTVISSVIDPKTKKVLIKEGELVSKKILSRLKKIDLKKAHIRSVVTCKAEKGVCRKCYGYDLAYNELVRLGTAVGIIAAQSIGEPGTQLTMRTFHTGGVAGGGDITQGLPRVEEIFEARPPKGEARIADIAGEVSIIERSGQKIIRILSSEPIREEHNLREWQLEKRIKNGTAFSPNTLIATNTLGEELRVSFSGKVKITKDKLILISKEAQVKEYVVPPDCALWVKDKEMVAKGTQLTEGHINLQTLFRLSGPEAVYKYIIREVQKIYAAQGEKIHEKHLEIIIRQMLSRVRIKDGGETEFLPGKIVDKSDFDKVNKEIKKAKKVPATGEQLLLGITKASLSTTSFLSAASFQETARVLIDAAVSGKVDRLEGLKENVIIGKLIPAGTGFRKEKKT